MHQNEAFNCRVLLPTAILLFITLCSAVAGPQYRKEIELARGNLLIADKNMRDQTFGNTVILLLNRDEKGVIGIILNRKSNIPVSEVLPAIGITNNLPFVLLGGPVAINSVRILIHTDQQPPMSTMITNNVWLIDTAAGLANYVEEIAGKSPSNVYLGYAGWLPGQLEAEILRGDWQIWPGDAETIFSGAPENLWFELQEQFQQIWAGLNLDFRYGSKEILAVAF